MDSTQILQGLTKFYDDNLNTPEGDSLSHLSNDITRISYIEKGQEVMNNLHLGNEVLDWGTGLGQMAYILTKLGANVTAFDVTPRGISLLPDAGLELILTDEEVRLPFPDNQFDSVLSCGVLEHVPNIPGSLKEILRVLKPGGKFFIYNLPYIMSPSEFYATKKKASFHPILFTKSGTRQLLETAGFEVSELCHENGIPKRLNGPLKWFRPLANNFPSVFRIVDKAIVKTPVIRTLISNSIRAVAVKSRENTSN